ncbi:hypothetical protein ATL41_1654 [Flavimobilis soli]|uniref:Protein kinase domain-containing protein n=1 Tax=Flavimobilis soli TaxID=442709 RepID=A0A2A9EED3_9MICO|nr:hypothetical protein [Flavimobilis soli]PFG36911.1 hypothetical protein ATL41_1654 [Flavimobilis soli]
MTDLTRGDVLAERYVLQDPVPSDVHALTCWTADDQILGRPVHVSLVSGPHRSAALDEARRASLVSDARLTRVLDVGDVDELGYVVTEPHVGQSLSAVLASGPLDPEQARAVVGEIATALAVAERRGVHHGHLRPEAVRLKDNRVHLTGLGLDGALVPHEGELTRSRADAVGLARLLAYMMLGRWTTTPPVPEAELADLDTIEGTDPHLVLLVRDTLTTRTGGLRDAEQAARDLAPWDAIDVPEPQLFAPTGLTEATEDDPTDTKVTTDMTPDTPPKPPVRQSVRAVPGSTGGRPPGTPPPATPPAPPRIPVRRTSVRGAAGAAAGGAGAGAGAAAAAAGAAAAAATGVAVGGSAPAGAGAAVGGGSAASAASGSPSAPPAFAPTGANAGTAPVRVSSRPATTDAAGSRPAAASSAPRAGAAVDDRPALSFDEVRKNPQELKRFRFNPTAFTLCIVFVLVVLGVTSALSELRGGFPNPFGQATGERPLPTAAEPSPGAAAGPTATPSAVAPVIASARQLDPDGDDNEHPEAVDRAIDLDPTTFWFTRTYKSNVYAGLNKRGVGYAVKLEQASLVSSIYLSTNNTGGKVEIRAVDPDTPDKGKALFSGALQEELEITLDAPVETEWIVLWFTQLPATADGQNRVELREISLT